MASNSFFQTALPSADVTSPNSLVNTSSYHSTGTGVRPSLMLSCSSFQSDRLSFGKITVLTPDRLAARVFSFRPPIRRTRPVNVSSPVIATSGSKGRFRASDRNDDVIATPAEGPSFGVAPSGKCKCICARSKNRFSTKRLARNILENEYAIRTDSFITSPSCPVRSTFGVESLLIACSKIDSMYNAEPPVEVHASPITTPGGVVSYSLSAV
ncbi:hypothetical protein OGAPHI_001260 [Ogataea philodendri]|uniref:Uncharacterized protein n=1 Tax=Ogataea philodendri TaxID=1378263 RepID=A0A9P8T9M3_9ASCO|nr:uncharacterized protein OGAPHI_001260 [Ogataea philodendri]KAH3670744.1 hypothetical protein OGAPHI_001260 [Ogataea philodendri]